MQQIKAFNVSKASLLIQAIGNLQWYLNTSKEIVNYSLTMFSTIGFCFFSPAYDQTPPTYSSHLLTIYYCSLPILCVFALPRPAS